MPSTCLHSLEEAVHEWVIVWADRLNASTTVNVRDSQGTAAALLAIRRRRKTYTALPSSKAKYLPTSSAITMGASGLNHSRPFIAAFIKSLISGLEGSAIMERCPSARGPNSDSPWINPTACPRTINSMISVHGLSIKRHRMPSKCCAAVSTDCISNAGPRKSCRHRKRECS